MERIKAAGHVNNRFVAEDIATNRPPTEVDADFMNSIQEEVCGVIEGVGIALNAASRTQLFEAIKSMLVNRNFAGLMRKMTPLGGAQVREYVDQVAATTGNIEIGIAFNCSVSAAGVWAGRDIADICWLEKWSDIGGVKEFWYAPTAAAGVVPTWTKVFSIDTVNGAISSGLIKQQFAGLARQMTPLGGAQVREFADQVAATTGNIEFGIAFNCDVSAAGVWAGRDISDICWLEKWSDLGGVKEFWVAPTAAAGVVPVWTRVFWIDMANGIVYAPTMAAGTNTQAVASTAFVQTALAAKAPLASPALTGVPTAPTAAAGTNTTQLSTTAFVQAAIVPKAPLASPAFTGAPTVPTAAAGTNTTQAASTAFVQGELATQGSIGVGQTWQDVLTSRAAGTVYTNTTGRPISVSVTRSVRSSGTNTSSMLVNGVTVAQAGVGYGTSQFLSAIVPPNATYQVTLVGTATASVGPWKELR